MTDINQAEFEAYYAHNRPALANIHAAASTCGMRSGRWANELLYRAAIGAAGQDGERAFELLSRAVARYLDEQAAETGLSAAKVQLGLQ